MIIYLNLTDDDYVDGWGSNRSNESEIEINLDEEHDFFNSDIHCWKYEDDELVFDEEKKQKLVKEREMEEFKPLKSEINEMALLELAGIIDKLKGGN